MATAKKLAFMDSHLVTTKIGKLISTYKHQHCIDFLYLECNKTYKTNDHYLFSQ
jgi:hypothetical protein